MANKIYKRAEPGSAEIVDQQKKLIDSGWKSELSEDSYLMNSCKLPWHEDRLREWYESPSSNKINPLHIDMGITTGCNMACHFCYGVIQARTGFQGKQGGIIFMPLKTINKVFSDAKAAGVRSIALIGEGENTLNPALYPALQFSNEIGLDVSLATHGASIKEQHYETLLKTLSWLRINISAGTSESYQFVHQRPWFERVVNNTKGLIALRRDPNVRLPNGELCTIGYQMVLTKRNFDQVIPLARLAVELEVDYLVIKACSDTPDGKLDAPAEEYLRYKEVFRDAERMSNERTRVIVRWEKLGNSGNKPYSRCHGTKFIIAISGNGNVFPCGHWFDIEKDRFLMGNVNDESLRDILASDRYWKSQSEIGKLDLRNCETNCRQHQVNIFLDSVLRDRGLEDTLTDYLEKDQPSHINFI